MYRQGNVQWAEEWPDDVCSKDPRRMPGDEQKPGPKSAHREKTLPGIGSRRLTPRYKMPADVLVVPMAASLEPFWATTEDVGHRGVFVLAARRPPIDALVMLKLVTQNGPPLRIKSRVVHAVEGVGFGCQFLEVTPEVAAAISRLVATASGASLPTVVSEN
ncbi:MAG: PilZ domain-containing protein [Deltaproteobacteria bacterium]|nr:PilZ domain-containing protein [Deltaproteobacteria bacterium]